MPATPIEELDLACTTCLGVSVGDAASVALWDLIAQNISPVTPPDPDPAPTPDILWWTFPDGAGNIITAAVGPNGTTDCTWPVGKSGSGFCIEGNGTSQEAQTASAVTYGTNIITVAFWAWFDATNSTRIIVESSAIGTNPNCFLIYIFSGELRVYGGGTTGVRQESITAPATGAWVHVLIVLNHSTAIGDHLIFVDAVEQSPTLINNTKTGTANFSAQIFNVLSRNAASLWLDGRIDDLRIYSGDRSADVVAIMGDA